MHNSRQIYGLTTEDVLELLPEDFYLLELSGIMLGLQNLKATSAEEVYIYLNRVCDYALLAFSVLFIIVCFCVNTFLTNDRACLL